MPTGSTTPRPTQALAPRSAAERASRQPGEILVTLVTNAGWTPLFPRAGAIVTDAGALLSHAAIVARELGIPGVSAATKPPCACTPAIACA